MEVNGGSGSSSYDDSGSDESTAGDYLPTSMNNPAPLYNPFDDHAPEATIKDLPFALKKLTVMKAQMKKWMMERLELESQARSMRKALQDHGVDADLELKPDALMTHFRNENIKLQHRNDELEDKIRDLSETLQECSTLDVNGCDVVSHVKEKMLLIRHRFILEKRKLRATIANLESRLQEAKDDSCCAALTQLRVKLRELMRDGKKGDQEMSFAVEKSIGTLAELSKSCDELREENRRLLAEVETLKNEIKQDYDLERDQGEIKELVSRVKTCEAAVAKLRIQLAERDNEINELQKILFDEKRNATQMLHSLEQSEIKLKAANVNNEVLKAELQYKDEKVSKLLDDLRQSTGIALTVSDLESQLDFMKLQMSQLQSERNHLADELKKSNEQLRRLAKQVEDLKAENQSLRTKAQDDFKTMESHKLKELSSKIDDDAKTIMRLREALEDLQSSLEIQSDAMHRIKNIASDSGSNESMDDRCTCLKLSDATEDFQMALEKQTKTIVAMKNYVNSVQDHLKEEDTIIKSDKPDQETKKSPYSHITDLIRDTLDIKKIFQRPDVDNIDRQLMNAVLDFENALRKQVAEVLKPSARISVKCSGDCPADNEFIWVNQNLAEALHKQMNAVEKMRALIASAEGQVKKKAENLPKMPFSTPAVQTNLELRNKVETEFIMLPRQFGDGVLGSSMAPTTDSDFVGSMTSSGNLDSEKTMRRSRSPEDDSKISGGNFDPSSQAIVDDKDHEEFLLLLSTTSQDMGTDLKKEGEEPRKNTIDDYKNEKERGIKNSPFKKDMVDTNRIIYEKEKPSNLDLITMIKNSADKMNTEFINKIGSGLSRIVYPVKAYSETLPDSMYGKFEAAEYLDLSKWVEMPDDSSSSLGLKSVKLDRINVSILPELKTTEKGLSDALQKEFLVIQEIKILAAKLEKNPDLINLQDKLAEASQSVEMALHKGIHAAEKIKELVDQQVLAKFQKINIADSYCNIDENGNKCELLGNDSYVKALQAQFDVSEHVQSMVDYDEALKYEDFLLSKKEKATATLEKSLADLEKINKLDKTVTHGKHINKFTIGELKIVNRNLESELKNVHEATLKMIKLVNDSVKLSQEKPKTENVSKKLSDLVTARKNFDESLLKLVNAGKQVITLINYEIRSPEKLPGIEEDSDLKKYYKPTKSASMRNVEKLEPKKFDKPMRKPTASRLSNEKMKPGLNRTSRTSIKGQTSSKVAINLTEKDQAQKIAKVGPNNAKNEKIKEKDMQEGTEAYENYMKLTNLIRQNSISRPIKEELNKTEKNYGEGKHPNLDSVDSSVLSARMRQLITSVNSSFSDKELDKNNQENRNPDSNSFENQMKAVEDQLYRWSKYSGASKDAFEKKLELQAADALKQKIAGRKSLSKLKPQKSHSDRKRRFAQDLDGFNKGLGHGSTDSSNSQVEILDHSSSENSIDKEPARLIFKQRKAMLVDGSSKTVSLATLDRDKILEPSLSEMKLTGDKDMENSNRSKVENLITKSLTFLANMNIIGSAAAASEMESDKAEKKKSHANVHTEIVERTQSEYVPQSRTGNSEMVLVMRSQEVVKSSTTVPDNQEGTNVIKIKVEVDNKSKGPNPPSRRNSPVTKAPQKVNYNRTTTTRIVQNRRVTEKGGNVQGNVEGLDLINAFNNAPNSATTERGTQGEMQITGNVQITGKKSVFVTNNSRNQKKPRPKSGNKEAPPEPKVDIAAIRAQILQDLAKENFAKDTLCLEASKDLKSEIKEQIEAIERVRAFINYATGRKTDDHEVEKSYESLVTLAAQKKWWTPHLRKLFDTTQELAREIQKTERDAQDLIVGCLAIKGDHSAEQLKAMRLEELSRLHDMIYKTAGTKDCDNFCTNQSLAKTLGCRCGVKTNIKEDMQKHYETLRRQIEEGEKQMEIQLRNTRKLLLNSPNTHGTPNQAGRKDSNQRGEAAAAQPPNSPTRRKSPVVKTLKPPPKK